MLTERKPSKINELKPSAERSRVAPTVLYETAGCVMATWQNLNVAVWATQGTVALAKKLDEVAGPFVKGHPEGISSVHIITKRAPLPDADARHIFSKISDRHASNIACVATVLDGSGFWVSAMQSFLTGLHVFSRRKYKTYYCLTTAEVARWLPGPHAARTGVTILARDLEQVLGELWKRID